MGQINRGKTKRRKKLARSIRRTLINIILVPARMPRINAEQFALITRICEAVAVLFVIVVMTHMIAPEIIGTFIVVACGLVFVGMLGLIGLSDYQDKLVEYELYGFRV